MYRLHLIHWKMDEADGLTRVLEDAGYRVKVESDRGNAILRKLGEQRPHAVLIDLSRMPSYGRDIALAIRMNKTTRKVPIVFVGGEPAKVGKIKRLLPDAAYAGSDGLIGTLAEVIENPPEAPVVPKSLLSGYSGTPLLKKLGIRANSCVSLLGAPDEFLAALGSLPKGVRLIKGLRDGSDLVIYFAESRGQLVHDLDALKDSMADKGGLWIAWPKKTSGVVSDLSQPEVRSLGLSTGLVDYKVCAIDSTWSGLKFAKRR